jgi:hypothetical protein
MDRKAFNPLFIVANLVHENADPDLAETDKILIEIFIEKGLID